MGKRSKNNAPLSFYFNSLGKQYIGALNKLVSIPGLDRYYYTLLLINDSPPPVTQQYLADFFNVDKAAMVRVIDYLTTNGFVKRKACPEDRRKHSLILTDKAQKAVPLVVTAINELNKICFNDVPEKDMNSFLTVLEKIGINLAALPQENIYVDYVKIKEKSKK
jgi:MarR family transcriptional regulator for hemolysin